MQLKQIGIKLIDPREIVVKLMLIWPLQFQIFLPNLTIFSLFLSLLPLIFSLFLSLLPLICSLFYSLLPLFFSLLHQLHCFTVFLLSPLQIFYSSIPHRSVLISLSILSLLIPMSFHLFLDEFLSIKVSLILVIINAETLLIDIQAIFFVFQMLLGLFIC